MIRKFAVLLFLATLAAQAWGQNAEELKRMLVDRDAEIQELRQRIQALEKERRRSVTIASEGPADSGEDEQDRALERTLVRQGGLVLPPGSYELEPSVSYAHWDRTKTALHYELTSALTLRAGFGWDSQLQVHVPYVRMKTATGSDTALGDIALSASRQLFGEKGSWPGVVGSLGWTSRTGHDGFDGEVATGSGFNVLQGGLTAVKRHDPLVFYGGLTYAAPIARKIDETQIAPGDIVGLRMGSILAATPATSVNVGLNLAFVDSSRVNGMSVPDSDATLGTLQIGFGMVLTRRLMLNISTEIGVTGTVPDFRLTATLPVRF